MIEPVVAYDKLRSLETPDEIKEFLEHQEIVGVRGDASQCVIAQWLRETTGEEFVNVAHQIKVGRKEVTSYDGPLYGLSGKYYTDRETYDLTPVIRTFIENFDDGAYPELEKESENTEQDWYYSDL